MYYIVNDVVIGKILTGPYVPHITQSHADEKSLLFGYSRLRTQIQLEFSGKPITIYKYTNALYDELPKDRPLVFPSKRDNGDKGDYRYCAITDVESVSSCAYDSLLIDTTTGEAYLYDISQITAHEIVKIQQLKDYVNLPIVNITNVRLPQINRDAFNITCLLDDPINQLLVTFSSTRGTSVHTINQTAIRNALEMVLRRQLHFFLPCINEHIYLNSRGLEFYNGKKLIFLYPWLKSIADIDNELMKICTLLLTYGIPSFPYWVYRFSQDDIEMYKHILYRYGRDYIYEPIANTWSNAEGNEITNPFLPLIIKYYDHRSSSNQEDIITKEYQRKITL